MTDSNVDLFKNFMYEYFMNKSDQLEKDRQQILLRVSLHHLDSDSYIAHFIIFYAQIWNICQFKN